MYHYLRNSEETNPTNVSELKKIQRSTFLEFDYIFRLNVLQIVVLFEVGPPPLLNACIIWYKRPHLTTRK